MKVVKQTKRMRLLSVLLMLCMVVSLTPVSAFGAVIVGPPIFEPNMTIEIPVSKTVTQGGTAAPKAETFEFEIAPVNTEVDISGLTITGDSIETDGAGTYRQLLTIQGDRNILQSTGGLRITEKNKGAESWTYDGASYTVEISTYGGWWMSIDDADLDMGYMPVNVAEFTNTYTDEAANPGPSQVTVEVSLVKWVECGGFVEPGEETFEFEVEPVNTGVDISGLTITGDSITTDGVGPFHGEIKIVGDRETLTATGGLRITEKNGEAEYWTYDETAYIVESLGNDRWMVNIDEPTLELDYGFSPYAEFYNTYTNDNVTGPVTMQIPLTKSVAQGGTATPVAETFTFDVAPVNEGTDISGLTITGNTIDTDGRGVYRRLLTIAGDKEIIDAAGGLRISEKNEGAENWSYDETEYIVQSVGYDGFIASIDNPDIDNPDIDIPDLRLRSMFAMELGFTNTYTDDSTAPGPPSVTIDVPLNKIAEKWGKVSPGTETFEFEVAPKNRGADISGLTITGTTVTTDGLGAFNGTLRIKGDPQVIYAADGLIISEKDGGDPLWVYDPTEYTLHLYNDDGDYSFWNDDIDIVLKSFMPGTAAVFTNYYVNNTTAPVTEVSIDVPIAKTVVQGGSVAPGAETFDFEVAPVTEGADISGLTITGDTLDTNGAKTYTGTLKIEGREDILAATGGLKVTEKNGGTDNWTYDTKTYRVVQDSEGNWVIKNDDLRQEVQTAAFTNTYTNNPPPAGPTNVTIEVPIAKTVVQGGSMTPGAETFDFEVAPVTEGADISALTITGDTIATDGADTYTGTMIIEGDKDILTAAGGLKITEKNTGAANWSYDAKSYRVTDDGQGSWVIKNADLTQEVQTASFSNTYTNNPPPAGPTNVTIEVPIAKTVVQGGIGTPGAETFVFEVAPVTAGADISGLTITGDTIATDGAKTYTGTLKIEGNQDVLTAAGGLKITEKNGGAADWIYDTKTYHVVDDGQGNWVIKNADLTQVVQEAAFTNTYTKNPIAPPPTGSTEVTIEVPLSETVVQGGNVKPGAKTFTFEVTPSNTNVDISSLDITGITIATDGSKQYSGILKITGDPAIMDAAGGLRITQKNDMDDNWSHDSSVYIVYRDTGSSIRILKDSGANTNPQSVSSANFTNTFTENTDTTKDENTDTSNSNEDTKKHNSSKIEKTSNPETNDYNEMLLWLVWLALSSGGIVTMFVVRRRRAHSK